MDSLKDASLLERKELPAKVAEACRYLENAPPNICVYHEINARLLLDYTVYPDRVVMVIGAGQKYTVMLSDLPPAPATTQAQPAPGKVTTQAQSVSTKATTKKTPAKPRATKKKKGVGDAAK